PSASVPNRWFGDGPCKRSTTRCASGPYGANSGAAVLTTTQISTTVAPMGTSGLRRQKATAVANQPSPRPASRVASGIAAGRPCDGDGLAVRSTGEEALLDMR